MRQAKIYRKGILAGTLTEDGVPFSLRAEDKTALGGFPQCSKDNGVGGERSTASHSRTS